MNSISAKTSKFLTSPEIANSCIVYEIIMRTNDCDPSPPAPSHDHHIHTMLSTLITTICTCCSRRRRRCRSSHHRRSDLSQNAHTQTNITHRRKSDASALARMPADVVGSLEYRCCISWLRSISPARAESCREEATAGTVGVAVVLVRQTSAVFACPGASPGAGDNVCRLNASLLAADAWCS